jgi:hypothetical protein
VAWIFSLSADCGEHKRDAVEFARYFEGCAFTINGGSTHTCTSRVFGGEGGWWAMVCPDGVSRSGVVEGSEEQKLMTALAMMLYETLRDAPAFRFAMVGIEVDGFRTYEELDQDIVNLDFAGLVLSEPVWVQLGSPDVFIRFADGYVWRPFVSAR